MFHAYHNDRLKHFYTSIRFWGSASPSTVSWVHSDPPVSFSFVSFDLVSFPSVAFASIHFTSAPAVFPPAFRYPHPPHPPPPHRLIH